MAACLSPSMINPRLEMSRETLLAPDATFNAANPSSNYDEGERREVRGGDGERREERGGERYDDEGWVGEISVVKAANHCVRRSRGCERY